MWNSEERYQLGLAAIKARETGGDETAMVGTRAVDLVAARGGTMTAEAVSHALGEVARPGISFIELKEWASRLGIHLTAQGATVAMLQAKVAELEKKVARQGHQLGPQLLREACDEHDTLRAEVERLKAELAEASPYQEMWEAATRELGALSSKTETVRVMWKERAEDAESRLAAIREKLTDDAIESWMDEPHDPEPLSDDALIRAFARWLEGDAANSPGSSDGSGDAPQEAKDTRKDCTCLGSCKGAAGLGSGWRCVLAQKPATPARYPCSPACTHDDAATPGHPERVKERSEALLQATPDPYDWGRSDGIETMRAACLEAVRQRLQVDGSMDVYEIVKAAIEGAAP